MRRNQHPPYRLVLHNLDKKGACIATGALGLSARVERRYITNSGTSAGLGAEGAFGFGTAMSV
jgi:hypothetical protein